MHATPSPPDAPPAPARRPVLFVAMSGVAPRAGAHLVDRKFHVGMLEFARRLGRPLSCLVPCMSPAEIARAIDAVEVPDAARPYEISTVSSVVLSPGDLPVLEAAIGAAAVVCIPMGGEFALRAAERCRARGVPYVALSECTLRTELDIMRSETPSPLRRAVRALRLRMQHRRKLAAVAAARELHANGYPTFEEFAAVTPRRLLYFDTRAQEADVIPAQALDARLHARSGRPPRLLFSGRYLPLKGALDVVAAGVELDRRGVDFRLDLFGTGPLEPRMRALAEGSPARGKITIHGAIPYKPDLVQVTRDADLFLSCHVQGDPSCTYLEALACGVPIVGYANEMWSVLCRESGAGRVVPLGDPRGLAGAAAALLADPAALRDASHRARRFALAHTMERAWDDRAARLAAIAGEATEGVSA